jgi:hypothetical protein
MKLVKNSSRFLTLVIWYSVMATNSSNAQKYLVYLHGAIMEGQTGNVKSGSAEYQYDEIVKTFKDANFTVISEIRKANTDVASFARQVADQLNGLLKKGVKPGDITVVGASKGALIAMYVSTYMQNQDMNFVFIAACNSGNFESFPDIRFFGNILSIYEKSDGIGESCIQFKNKSGTNIRNYKEIELNTGFQHQFLWKPLPEWTKPVIEWANQK